MAPITVPMKNGAASEEKAKIPPVRACSEASARDLRNAKPAPRSTMAKTASMSGSNRVEVIAANAAGNAVQRMTRSKISHTWFVSQTGPIAWSIRAQGNTRPRAVPPASRSHRPPPKSAPPRMAWSRER